MNWLLWFGLVIGVLLIVVAALRTIGAKEWAANALKLTRRLDASRTSGDVFQTTSVERYDARELEHLPAPVQRYFRAVLQDGQPIVEAANLGMTGTFNMSATGEQWKPFTSQQRVITRRPGFLWNAQIMMMPGLPVQVVDSYIAGNGSLKAAVLGLFVPDSFQNEP